MVAGAAVGYVTTSRTPDYTATATIYVGAVNLGADETQLFAQAGLDDVVASFAAMIPSPVIAQKAINETHVDRYSGEVAASTVAVVEPSTSLIAVSVTDVNAATAIRLANGVSNAFVNQVSQYQSSDTAPTGTRPNEPAYVFQNAVSAVESSTGLIRALILGILFGLIIAVLAILLLDYLDVTIKSPEELERRVGLPVLGIIPLLSSLPLDGPQPAGSPMGRTTGARRG